MERVSILQIALLYCVSQLVEGADPAVTPGAKGAAVVQDVVKQIQDSKVFQHSEPHVGVFLTRIAQVESRCGEDDGTYRDGYNGGIWQVDEIAFKDTKDTSKHDKLLPGKHEAIKKKFGIDWPSVKWEDLRKPLYSGLAARLYLSNKTPPIPESLKDQAKYWKDHYNTEEGDGKVEDFIDRGSTVKGDPHVTQLVYGSDIPLCYDVFGKGGSIYNLLSDNDMGIKIHAILDSEKQNIAKYIVEVAVMIGSHTFNINKDGATINNNHYDWNQYTDIQLDDVHFQTDENGMTINFMGLVWIDVINLTYLDMEIHHLGTFSEETKGILGDVANNVKIVETNSGADLYLTNGDTTDVIHLTKESCWKIPSLGPRFEELILRNEIQCMLC